MAWKFSFEWIKDVPRNEWNISSASHGAAGWDPASGADYVCFRWQVALGNGTLVELLKYFPRKGK